MAETIPTINPLNSLEEFFQNDFSSAINSANEFTENRSTSGSALNPEEKRTESPTSTEATAVGASPEVPKEVTVFQPNTTQVNLEVNVPNTTSNTNQTTVVNQTNDSNTNVKTNDRDFSLARRFLGLDLDISSILQNRITEQIKKEQQVLNQATEVQKKIADLSSTSEQISSSSSLNTINNQVSTITDVDSIKLKLAKEEALSRLFGGKRSTTINPDTGSTSQPTTGESTKEEDRVATTQELPGIDARSPNLGTGETTEVTKTSPSFSEKIPQSSEKIIEKSNANVLEKTQSMLTAATSDVSNNQKTVEMNVVSSERKEMPTVLPQNEATTRGNIIIDLDPLEARLARLEYILSNPLEVKIID